MIGGGVVDDMEGEWWMNAHMMCTNLKTNTHT